MPLHHLDSKPFSQRLHSSCNKPIEALFRVAEVDLRGPDQVSEGVDHGEGGLHLDAAVRGRDLAQKRGMAETQPIWFCRRDRSELNHEQFN